ncbi:MAG: T9SS type A sorting domain-containing protein [Flavobacteriales bacterium]|nr:T9SS type A sorting domain-containing protein [Flavobacteriales bacterium]
MKNPYALFALAVSISTGSLVAQPGTLDPSFGGTGIVTLQPGDFHDVTHDVIALADNSSLICGVARHLGRNAIFIGHILEDGSLDAFFGTDQGYTYFNIGEEAYGYAMGTDSQGRIYVCGLAYPTFAQAITVLVRVDGNGQPDASFGANGVLEIPVGTSDSEAKGLVVLANDDVVLGGSAIGADFVRDAMIVKISSASGNVDTNFGSNGFVFFDGPSGEALLNDVAVVNDGSVVGVGYTDVNFLQKTILVRAGLNGNPDVAFGPGGVLLPDLGTSDHSAWGALASGSEVYVTGMVWSGSVSDVIVMKVRADGSYDPIFGGGSPVLIDMNDYEVGFDMVEADGQLYVCGTTGEPGFGTPRDFFVAKMNGDGVLNSTFGTGGYVITSIQDDFDDANALAMQPDGKLLAVGFTAGFSTGGDNDVALVRYLDDGTTATHGQEVLNGSVFPNPSVGAMVSVRTRLTGGLTATVIDAGGRQVGSSYHATSPIAVLDIATLATGRYTIQLLGNGGVERHALVIAR